MSQANDSQTLTADGETTAVTVSGPARLSLTGTFGSGTAQLQARGPDGVYVDVTGGEFTAATDTLYDFPNNTRNDLRVTLTGATAPALKVWIQAG